MLKHLHKAMIRNLSGHEATFCKQNVPVVQRVEHNAVKAKVMGLIPQR